MLGGLGLLSKAQEIHHGHKFLQELQGDGAGLCSVVLRPGQGTGLKLEPINRHFFTVWVMEPRHRLPR